MRAMASLETIAERLLDPSALQRRGLLRAPSLRTFGADIAVGR